MNIRGGTKDAFYTSCHARAETFLIGYLQSLAANENTSDLSLHWFLDVYVGF